MAMAMCRRGRVLLGVHHERPPTDEEWARWIALALDPSAEGVRTLVESGGSTGPNAKQRRALAVALQGADIRSAILTDSLMGDPEPRLQRLAKPDLRYVADFWLLSHADLRDNARVRAVRDCISTTLLESLALFRG